MRRRISLDGAWQFQIDPQNTLTLDQITIWRTIQVPAPWQAQFDDLHLSAGVGWYRRTVDVPADWAGRAVFLCFGAVDYFAEVWVNDRRAGEHEGGYLPFELDVSALLRYGATNEMVVRVVDPGGGLERFGMAAREELFPEFPFREIPHGKQSWYGPIGGIWQSVWLEARAPRFVRQVHVTPDGLSGRVAVSIWLAGQGEAAQLNLRCLSPSGAAVAGAGVNLEPGQDQAVLTFTIAEPAIWDLDSPSLYTLEVDLLASGAAIDRQTVAFGVRTFAAREGRLWLNGRPFYMRGALDQDYYPHGIYTPPSLDFLRDQFRKGKAMGLNLLRCHIKVPDPRYVQAADEVGLLLWIDVPSWGHLTEAAARRARATFAGMVARDWNHPSVVMWALVNENWGTDLPGSEADRRWLRETFAWAKAVDPHRVIVDNSACIPNFHVQTDVDDYHFYTAMPDSMDKWQQFVTGFANRGDFTFSPNGDGIRTGQEPLVVSEFGNWGLPDLERLKAAYGGKEPWWFVTGGERGVVSPQGAEQRFRALGLDAIFGDWSGLAEATQWAQYRALKHEIEVMRAEPAISGYVITEFTDLHWECNGLMDMARNPRVFADVLPVVNADTVIVPRWERLAYWSGERVAIDLLVSHYGREPIQGATLEWSLEGVGLGGGSGQISAEPGAVVPAGSVSFDAPAVSEIMRATLKLWLKLPGGEVIAHNELSLNYFPVTVQRASAPIAVWTDDSALMDWFAAAGYTPGVEGALRVVTHLTDETRRYVQAGGRALLCTSQEGVIPGLAGLEVAAREGTVWTGDWASSFGWVRPGLTRLGGPLIDFVWRGAIARHIITGASVGDMLAGLFVGWVHLPAAFAVRIRVGQGMLTVATFPVLPPDNAPARTVLLHDLIRAAG